MQSNGGCAWQGGAGVAVGRGVHSSGACMTVGGGHARCVHGRGTCMAGERAWRGVCMVGEKCVAGETAIAVGGMHPTGMHSCQIVISTWDNKYEIFINLLLLSATVVAERLCFQGCLSTGRCTSPLGRHPPARQTPPSRHPPGQTPPPPRWLLPRTVRILLECILVLSMVSVLFILKYHLNENWFTCCPFSIKLSHFPD